MQRIEPSIVGLLLAAAGCIGCNGNSKTSAPVKSSVDHQSAAEAVQHASNNSPITISGTVAASQPDRFTLDYGKGFVTVEMDDWDWYREGYNLLKNDDVVVQGYIDDDFYEKRTIEASTVYVQDLGTQFHASGVDEEDFPLMIPHGNGPAIELRGHVTETGSDQFKLDTGMTSVQVGTEDLAYDPLDDEGFQQIDVGDYVRVNAVLEPDLFDGQALSAVSIVSLQ